jgi:hypothetical protein
VQASLNDQWHDAGLTLVELMVAIGVTTIIMALSTLVFVAQYKSYRTGHSSKTTEADIQKALELVRDDLTFAGWGVKPEMAFYIVDGGANGTDQIYANDIYLMDANSTADMIKLVDSGIVHCGGCRLYQGNTPDPTHKGGSVLLNSDSVSDLGSGVPVLAAASDGSGQTWATSITTGSTSGALSSTAGMNTEKWVTPAILYSVTADASTGTMALRRDVRGESGSGAHVVQPVAEGVVDLQLIYGGSDTRPLATGDYFGDGTDSNGTRYGRRGCGAGCQMNPFRAANINWMNLYLVTRSADRTRDSSDPSSCRPAVANRSAGNATTCGYEYRVYVTRVTPLGGVH